MLLKDKKIGFALTGSFCTFEKTIPQISKLIEVTKIENRWALVTEFIEGTPLDVLMEQNPEQEDEYLEIMSFNSYKINSRFGESREFIRKIEEITNKKIINTIEEAEPIGVKRLTDIMVIAPCSRKHNWKISKWNC